MQDSNVSAGKNFTAHALQGINLFAQNNALKIHAAKGKVEIQAKNNKIQIMAAIKLVVWMGIVDRDSLRYI